MGYPLPCHNRLLPRIYYSSPNHAMRGCQWRKTVQRTKSLRDTIILYAIVISNVTESVYECRRDPLSLAGRRGCSALASIAQIESNPKCIARVYGPAILGRGSIMPGTGLCEP